eukprot:993764_1
MADTHDQTEHLLPINNDPDIQDMSIYDYSIPQDDDGDNAAYASLGSHALLHPPERVNVSTSHPVINTSSIQYTQPTYSSPKAPQPIIINEDSISDNLLRLGTPSKPTNYVPWSPRGASLYLQDKFRAGSVKGSIFTLIICIVGAGALSLPR